MPLPAAPRRATAMLLLASALGCAAAPPALSPNGLPPVALKAPYYGDALFQLYQDRGFQAITTLMASQQLGRIQPHDDDAELLRGGMLLAWGLHDEAERLFAGFVQRGASASLQSRAWLALAKLRYQRGLPDQAEAALAQVGEHLDAPREEERRMLQAQLALARGDAPGAAAALQALAERPRASAYVRFNLGVAQVRAGDVATGTQTLDSLGRASAPDEELRALRDKANLALGYAALQDQRPADARRHLARVRLAGAHSHKALLGFGWAAAALKDYPGALVPWQALAARDGGDAAVLEAHIAVPYALAELGAHGQALQHYQAALALYQRQHAEIDTTVAAVRSGSLLQALARLNPGGDDMGWFYRLDQLPQDLPHPGHLGPVLAEHGFQEAFKNWRDLHFLSGNLADWAEQLGVFGHMLDHRVKSYAQRLPGLAALAATTTGGTLAAKVQALAVEVAQADTAGDGLALANLHQQQQWQRLQQMRQALATAGADPELAGLPERLRRLQGALVWALAHAQPERQWQAHKGVAQLQQGLAEAGARQAAIAQAQAGVPQQHALLAQRIAALAAQVQAARPRVTALAAEQQMALQGLVVAALQAQQERLAGYATQARFAAAQLTDRAQLAAKDSDAAPR